MKTVVITGSTRGLGIELAKCFKKAGCNVVINGINEDRLKQSMETLSKIEGEGTVTGVAGSVSSSADMSALISEALKVSGKIDIWVNNAGVNQPMVPVWELSEADINAMIDIDLKGTVMTSKIVFQTMKEQGFGAIYNVEGFGSNDAYQTGLSIYGTTKRAITYFSQALAKESEALNAGVIVGRLSPGIMITDFTVKALGGQKEITLSEKTKKVYNILGDYPDVVADFLTEKILSNTKNNVHIEWLTGAKAAWRFMTAGFNKRNFFE